MTPRVFLPATWVWTMVVLQVAVAEQFLDGADVVALLQQVGGKAVAQGVNRGVLGDICLADCPLELALQVRDMDVMPPLLAGAGVARVGGGREHPEPPPLFAGIGVLDFKGMGQRDPFAIIKHKVLLECLPGLGKVGQQVVFQRIGQDRDPILVSLAGTDGKGCPFEVDILDPEGGALLEPQPATVDQPDHEQVNAAQVAEDPRDLLFAENHGEPPPILGADGFGDIVELLVENVAEEEEQGVECLVLGRGGNLALDGDMA